MNTTGRTPRTALITALAYVPALLSMMCVGILVPFIGPLARELGTTPAALGLAIALYSAPTALLASVSGVLIDRFGLKRSLLLSMGVASLASLLASRAGNVWSLNGAMLLAGLGYSGISVGAPCLLMSFLQGAPRTRALAFLSTYAPAGYSAGLLVAAAFVAAGSWRNAFIVHAAIMAVALLALARLLPQPANPLARTPTGNGTLRAALTLLRDVTVLRLGVAVALPNAVSYGTSLAAPAYLARAYELSLASSSVAVATAKIVAMILGSLFMGHLLARSTRATLLFGVMAAIGIVAQFLIFIPVGGIAVATAALVIWIFAFGGMAGGAMALLPAVVRNPAQGGAAAGMVNQLISAASFAAPSTWLALQHGPAFVGLAAGLLLVSLVSLPRTILR